MGDTEWRECQLGDLLTLQRGFDLPYHARKPGRVPIVSSSGPSGFHSEAKCKAPGIVTGRYGTLGEVHFINQDYWPHNTALYVKDMKGNDPRFLYYLLGYTNLAHHNDKSGVPGVNRNDLHQIEVLRPPLPEQRSIARVLGGLDDKIELNRRMNRTLEDLARGLFRSWFVDFDPVLRRAGAAGPRPGATPHTPPHAPWPARLVDSPLGPIPEGWRVGTVADLARYVNGRNFTKDASGTGRMVVRIAELNSGPGGSTVYNDVKAEPENVVHPGDLLFAWSGSLDVYRWHRDEALVNQHIFKVVCEAYPQWFVHFHLCEAMPFFQGIAADKATTMGHIKREHLRQAELALPTDAALKYAGAQIEPIYARMLANERDSLRLAATRDALLPVLLSGEVRLRSSRQEDRAVRDAERAASDSLQPAGTPRRGDGITLPRNGKAAGSTKGRA